MLKRKICNDDEIKDNKENRYPGGGVGDGCVEMWKKTKIDFSINGKTDAALRIDATETIDDSHDNKQNGLRLEDIRPLQLDISKDGKIAEYSHIMVL